MFHAILFWAIGVFASCEPSLADRVLARLAREHAKISGGTMVRTENHFGTSIVGVDPYVGHFVAAAKSARSVLEVGAGHGLSSARAIENGASAILVSDLNSGHLNALREELTPEQAGRVKFREARFPGDFESVPAESFDLILIARVLHFFQPPEFGAALKALYRLLAPGGQVVATALTPENSHFPNFFVRYQAARARGESWPGSYLEVAKDRPGAPLPPFLHLLDPEVLEREFRAAGFEVDRVGYIDRHHQYTPDVLRDGREGVGIIARRPRG